MARKSRKEIVSRVKNAPAAASKKIYRTVIYVRLSSEDERKILSESVDNQISLLKDFVEAQDEMELTGIYVDRSISGTGFDRPDFNRMVEDMKKGKFDCVVVKDFSRLGRNYLMTGDYLETVFPLYGIRVVAVTDDYDSISATAMEDGIVVPFKNMMNEAYAKDASRKIASTIEEMQKAGLFVGKFAPYGYRKAPGNPHKLVVDEPVREYVVLVFESRAAGMSVAGITRLLNEKGIVTPMRRRMELGVGKKHTYVDKPWDKKLVGRILRNVAYMGDMEQGFEKRVLYLGIKERNREAEKRYYVKDTHEPIVSRELFERVQELLDEVSRKVKNSHDKYADVERKADIFRGLLYCGSCNRQMMFYRRTAKLQSGYGNYYTYMCRYGSDTYENACKENRIKLEALEEMVSALLHGHIQLFLDTKALLEQLNREPEICRIASEYGRKAGEVKGKLEHTRVMIAGLYDDFTDGILGEADYLYTKKQYQSELKELEEELSELEYLRDSHMADFSISRQMEDVIGRYAGFTELTEELLHVLVSRITYYGDNRYEVRYRFCEEFSRLQGLVDQRKEELDSCRKEK